MRLIAVLLIGLGLTVGLAACNQGGGAGGGGSASTPSEMSLGPANAKVTVIEYASLGCPICARFNNELFQSFKTKYIDSGKVHYVFREFLTGDAPVAAAGFLLAHCVGKDKYFQVVDSVFRQEADLLETDRGPEKRAALIEVAQSAGLTEAQFDACVTNDAALKSLNDKVAGYAKTDSIDSTPTFVINGKKYDGPLDKLDEMSKVIDAALAAAK
ncbi:MAG: thioredoxin domain-containing protein [Caulobacterales bacterium]